MTQAIQAYWSSEPNLILLADESAQRENKSVLLVSPHEYFYAKHGNDCTTCSTLKRPNFSSLSQYIIIMLLTLSSESSPSLSFFTFRPFPLFAMIYDIRLLLIGVESFHLNESFFLLITSIGKTQCAQLKGPSTPEGFIVGQVPEPDQMRT